MVAGGGDLPSYINPDDLVEITEAVAQHRDQTRRVLSTGCEDIASSYFATQYGTSQQQSQQQSKVCSKSNSKSNSRRNSFSTKTHCNNNLVASTMASAAAKIAKLKQQEREDQRQTFKDQQQQQNNQQYLQQQQQQIPQEKQINQQQQMVYQQEQQQMQQQQMQQQQLQQLQQLQQQQRQMPNQRSEDEKKAGSGSRRGSQQFSYLNLLPEDGSYPHRTQPIGEPMTKKTNSTDPSPARELGRRQSFKGSSEYLHATSNTNYAARSNPIGLAEPSMGRDGYGIGKDGSMYRSTGNLNVAGGSSRAGSVTRETNNSWKGERRSSSSDVKGCGIRTGGNMIEPSSKPPPSFNMPFGSGGKSFNYSKKSSRSSKTTTKRERNKSISGSQHSTMDVTLPRPKVRAHSMPRGEVNCEQTSYTLSLPPSTNNSRQTSVEPESKRTLTRYGSVEIFDAGYKMVLPNKQNKQTQHTSQTKLEELQADHYFFPGKVEENVEVNKVKPTVEGNLVKPTVECIGVEIGHSEKTKVGSNCEVKEELSNLTNQISNFTSSNSKASNVSSTNQSFQSIQQSSTEYEEHLSYQETSSSTTTQTFQSSMQSNQQSMQQSNQQSMQSNQQSIQQSNQQSMQQSNQQSMQSNQQSNQQSMQSNQQSMQQSNQHSMQSNQQSMQQSNNQQTIEKSGKSRSRNPSGSNGMVVQGNRFNIENGLKRNSRTCSTENISKTSQNHQISESSGMMKQLDVALQEYTNQQQKSDQVHYVAKVQSRTTSRRGSMAVTTGEDDVQNITVSLPSSRNQSRTHSRRNSVDMGKRSSRRNSLDIYTAEYAIKLQKEKKDGQNSSNKHISNDKKFTIDTLEQKSAFHVKVANEADSGLNLCGRCHLPTHKTADCTEYADFLCPCCLSWDHWIDTCPVQESDYICTSCNYLGHLEEVHLVSKFSQRRTCVDLLGWEPFQMWFYEPDFRNWWQVTGCCGVPLYKIYPRKTEWRKERKPDPVDSTGRGLSKNDSVDDMIAQVLKQRKTRPPPPNSGDGSSGCSSPDLNHEATIARINNLTADGEDSGQKRKPRTFSQTLNSLDKDILAELDL